MYMKFFTFSTGLLVSSWVATLASAIEKLISFKGCGKN